MDIISYLLGKKTGGGGKGGLKYVIVDELPTVGEDNTIYLVPKETEGTNNYYDEYMYINNSWEKIGDTEVDLSSKQDVMQFASMPSPSASTTGKIIQYTGESTQDYTKGYFYVGVEILPSSDEDPITYDWENINVQNSGGQSVSYANVLQYNSSENAYVLTDLDPGVYFLGKPALTSGPSSTQSTISFKIGNSLIQNNVMDNCGYIQILKKPSEAPTGSSEYDYSSVCAMYMYNNKTNSNSKMVKFRRTGTLTYVKDEYTFLSYVSPGNVNQTIMGQKSFYTLPKSSYASMPTTDDQFVIKKYVDNKPTTYSGYDATKTQVLKNINGTLTWVDE